MLKPLEFLIAMRRILERIPIPTAPERWGPGSVELDSLLVERAYDTMSPEAREALADVQEWFRDLMTRQDELHREATQLGGEIGWRALQVLAEAVIDGGDGGPDAEADPADPDVASATGAVGDPPRARPAASRAGEERERGRAAGGERSPG